MNDLLRLMKWKLEQPLSIPLQEPNRCAVFTSYLPVRVGAADDEIWRLAKNTLFWEKDVWLFPIHRPFQEHWTAVAVFPHAGNMFVFDSFAQQRPCQKDVEAGVQGLASKFLVLTENYSWL